MGDAVLHAQQRGDRDRLIRVDAVVPFNNDSDSIQVR